MNNPNHHNFTPGTRVRFHSLPHLCPGAHLAPTPLPGVFVHLNARPFITGVVAPSLSGLLDYVTIRPDGWPLPSHNARSGFSAWRGSVINWPKHATAYPCVLVYQNCTPVPEDELKRLVEEYLERTHLVALTCLR